MGGCVWSSSPSLVFSREVRPIQLYGRSHKQAISPPRLPTVVKGVVWSAIAEHNRQSTCFRFLCKNTKRFVTSWPLFYFKPSFLAQSEIFLLPDPENAVFCHINTPVRTYLTTKQQFHKCESRYFTNAHRHEHTICVFVA